MSRRRLHLIKLILHTILFLTISNAFSQSSKLTPQIITKTTLSSEEDKKFHELILNQLKKQDFPGNKRFTVELLNHARGYKLKTIHQNNRKSSLQSYFPKGSLKKYAEMAVQDIRALISQKYPDRIIQPVINHSFNWKYLKDIFTHLPGDFTPLNLNYDDDTVQISHLNGILHLSSPFILTDRSFEDLYNWERVNKGENNLYLQFDDFILTLSNDNKYLNKKYFSHRKSDIIPVNMEAYDFLFRSRAWEIVYIKDKNLVTINLNNHQKVTNTLSTGYLTAASLKDGIIWAYDTLDKRIHKFNLKGKWLNSFRPQIHKPRSPFNLIVLKDESFLICDYGQMWLLNPDGTVKWKIEKYEEKGILYSLPGFFTPSLSKSEDELYILDLQNNKILYYHFDDYKKQNKEQKEITIEKQIEKALATNQLLKAQEILLGNKSAFQSRKFQLKQRFLNLLIKKQLCQAMLIRAQHYEQNLCLNKAAQLFTYYLEQNKILQKMDPLNHLHPRLFEKFLKHRNNLNHRISTIQYQAPEKDIEILWVLANENLVTGTINLINKLPLPIKITLRLPGEKQSITREIKTNKDLENFTSFQLTDEIKHKTPLRISLFWPAQKKENLWEFPLELSNP